MGTSSQLASKLHTLDGKSYGALKALTGQWDFESFSLFIDKVQSDPYAPPLLECTWICQFQPPRFPQSF
ncbi:ABC-ATPase domain-containing protein [uncultured Rothia sp.]|uniref:ABC-ATPase domain-containing protein n=1 Tax=uncultured Rothia sp. TaxID=316088 RepID=UPI003217429A